jgi:hypothetical protein
MDDWRRQRAGAASQKDTRPAVESEAHSEVIAEYSIVVDKSSGKKLGLQIDDSHRDHLHIADITEGLVPEWNAKNPNQQVKTGDCVVELNGVRVYEEMMAECIKNQVLNLSLRRYATCKAVSEPITKETVIAEAAKISSKNEGEATTQVPPESLDPSLSRELHEAMDTLASGWIDAVVKHVGESAEGVDAVHVIKKARSCLEDAREETLAAFCSTPGA